MDTGISSRWMGHLPLSTDFTFGQLSFKKLLVGVRESFRAGRTGWNKPPKSIALKIMWFNKWNLNKTCFFAPIKLQVVQNLSHSAIPLDKHYNLRSFLDSLENVQIHHIKDGSIHEKKKKNGELSQKPFWHSTKTHSAGWALMQSTTGTSLLSQPTSILLCTYLEKNARNGISEKLPFKYILWAACPRTLGRSPQIVNSLLPAVSLLLPDLLRTLWRCIYLALLWNRIIELQPD